MKQVEHWQQLLPRFVIRWKRRLKKRWKRYLDLAPFPVHSLHYSKADRLASEWVVRHVPEPGSLGFKAEVRAWVPILRGRYGKLASRSRKFLKFSTFYYQLWANDNYDTLFKTLNEPYEKAKHDTANKTT